MPADHVKGANEIQQLLRDGGVSEATHRLQEDANKMSPKDWNNFCKELQKVNEKDVKANLPVVELVFHDRDKDGVTDIDCVNTTKGPLSRACDLLGGGGRPHTKMTPDWITPASVVDEKARAAAGATPPER